jgi:hypothetical protein
MTPVLQGLPGDRCPSPHWGVVLVGTITIAHADGTSETAQAGQLYHWPAGHTGVTEGGVTFMEVGPVEPMREFSEHARKLFPDSGRLLRAVHPASGGLSTGSSPSPTVTNLPRGAVPPYWSSGRTRPVS